jgi:hypothetical protein
MRRIAQGVAVIMVLLGVFWAGRESGHGLDAFSEHWWCPIPLGLVVVGLLALLVVRRNPDAA